MQYIYIIGAILSWVVIAASIVHVVLDNRQPVKTMAWVLVMFFLPLLGIVLYLLFGVNHRRERFISQRQLDQLSKRSMLSFVEQPDLQIPDAHKPLVDLFVNQNLSLPFNDNRFDVMTDGYQFFPALLRDIASATHHIHIDMYIFADDALGRLVSDALIARARAGVEVRVIYDDVGCWRVCRRFFERMREEGIDVIPFLPVRFPSFTSKLNYRDHRKMVIVDGRVGYVGGMNIALRYVKGLDPAPELDTPDAVPPLSDADRVPWRDTMMRMEGVIVYSLQRAFLLDWYFVDRTLISSRQYYPVIAAGTGAAGLAQVVTSGPNSAHPEIMQGYVKAIAAARQYVYIETPYFMPSDPVLFALKMAAVAGVDVRVMCPLASDSHLTDWASRPYLRELYEAGAHVLLYRAGFLHSKLMVVDDQLSTCGSTNVDVRSFENNFEVSLFVYDGDVARRLKQVFLDDQRLCRPLSDMPERLKPRFLRRLWESLIRLFSPLL